MKSSLTFFLAFCLLSFPVMAQQSFTLQEAITFGLSESNELKLKDVAAADAAQQVKEIRAIGIPKVSASVNYQHYLAVPAQPVQDFIRPSVYGVLFAENVIPERDLGQPQTFKFSLFQPNSLNAGVEASTLLFDGSYIYGLKAARFYKDLVSQEKQVTAQSVKENVTKAYLSVLLARENLKVMEQNLLNVTKSLDEIKAMYKNGFAESLDVDRLQLSYENLSTEVTNIRQLEIITKNLLKFQMNFPMDQEIELSQSLSDILLEWNNSAEIEGMELSLGNREEYKLIELSEQLNELDYKRTKAGYYPTLRGFANVQGNLYRKDLFDNNETGWIPQSALGVALQVPIYDGGEKQAKLQRIQLRNRQTSLEKSNLENAIRLQASNALLTYQNASKTMETRKKLLDMTNSIYNKTLLKFKEGVGSSLEVTQAESDLLRAQASFTEAGYSLLSSILDWKKAHGKL